MGAEVVKVENFPGRGHLAQLRAQGQRRVLLLRRAQPQQEEHCAQHEGSARQGNLQPARGEGRHHHREFPPRRGEETRHRLRLGRAVQSRGDLCLDVGLRPDRAVRRQGRLRHHRAGHVRDHDDDRRARRPSGQGRHRDERHRQRRHRPVRHPRRLYRQAAYGQGPVPGDFAARSGPRVDAVGIRRLLRLGRSSDRPSAPATAAPPPTRPTAPRTAT